MVKQGKFSVEIVHADTKMAFPEHTAPNGGGETYVEVEPDAEYFIRIKTDSVDKVRVDLSVDGNSLGYHSVISGRDSHQDKGLWEYKDGKSYNYALKFAKANVRQASSSSDGNTGPAEFWTGKIQADFSEAIFHGYKEQQDTANTWQGGDVSFVMGISDPDKKKGVKSDMGESFVAHKSKRRRMTYRKGGLLKSVTLRYCSTLGLIHAGVIASPGMWEEERMRNPRPANDPTEGVPKPERVEGEDGREVEVFDLTED